MDVNTGQVTAGPFEGHTSRVNCVAFSHDSKQVVAGSNDETIRIWDVETGQTTTTPPFKGHTSWVTSVVFSLDSKRVVSGSYARTIRI
jgi:WD40 repeat protein